MNSINYPENNLPTLSIKTLNKTLQSIETQPPISAQLISKLRSIMHLSCSLHYKNCTKTLYKINKKSKLSLKSISKEEVDRLETHLTFDIL